MNLTEQQKRICEQVVNVFETGKVQGNYSAVTILPDGPHGIKQVTYGRSQTTEYSSLHDLIELYIKKAGKYAGQLQPYLIKIGTYPLADNEAFKALLHDAGANDPVMQAAQDEFFDEHFFKRASQWFEKNGFTLPLSALVIYDSFIHSGSIPDFLRKHFSENVPAQGGDEKAWIKDYVDARHNWLGTASNAVLHATVYRTQCFKNEIARNNWDLAQLPISAHGVNVSGL
jgi:chitosanase